MATTYEEREGGYTAALSELLTNGGQLYCGDSEDGCTSVVRGSKVFRYWSARSAKKGKMIEACQTFGYDPYGMTGGSLCRKIISEVLEIPYKGTSYSNVYRDLAKKGHHWHYQFIKTGDHGKCIEYDLSSAYMSQFLRLESTLIKDVNTFLDDNGAMERLKTIMPLFPKWLRVQFLGVIASHSRTYITRKKGENGYEIEKKTQNSIAYGGAFNATHRAILRVYRIMERIHQIAGDYCVRMHTDSFTLKTCTPKNILLEIFDFLERNEQEVQIKGIGRAFFFDLNEGIIGSKLIGAKEIVSAQLHEINFKQSREPIEEEYARNWEDIIEDIHLGMNNRKSIPINYEQIKINWLQPNQQESPDDEWF